MIWTIALILLRLYVVALLWSGGPVSIAYGCGEFIAICLSILNEIKMKERDKRPIGIVLPLAYVIAFVVSPAGNGSEWLVWPLSVVVVVLTVTRLWLFHRTSIAKATWVSLCDTGPYRIVRHPQYSLAMLARVIFLLANPSPWNIFASIVYGCVMYGATRVEEGFCEKFPEYRAYSDRVRFRFVPGLL